MSQAKLPTQPEIEPAYMADVVPVCEIEGIDWDRRLTLRRLVLTIAQSDSLGIEEVSGADLAQADRASIEAGLYISNRDPRYRIAEGLVKFTWDESTAEARAAHHHPDGASVPPPSVGVVFPPDQYGSLAHYAGGIVRRSQSKTRKAHWAETDREEADQIVGRSGVHTLENYIDKMSRAQDGILAERDNLRKLRRDLVVPVWQSRLNARKIDASRADLDEKIHEYAELASISLNAGTFSVRGMHKAIKRKLYRGSEAEILQTWRIYISMNGRYANSRVDRISSAIASSQDKIKEIKPIKSEKLAE